MIKLNLPFLALCACLGLSPAHAEMSANDAFNLGHAFGAARNAEVREGIKSDEAASNVPNYSATSDKSALYGGMTNLGPLGTNEKIYCQTDGLAAPSATQREACNATNMLSSLKDHAPAFTINRETDPLMIRKRQILADPVAASGMPFATSLSECTTDAVTTSNITREETCFDAIPLPTSSSCQMPWEVDVLQHNRYRCLTGKKSSTHECSDNLVVTCTGGAPGCTSGGIIPGSVYLTNGTYGFSLSENTLTIRNTVTAENSRTSATFNLTINDLARVTDFHLTYVHSDNWTALEINGVHVATHGRAIGGLHTPPASDRLEHFWEPSGLRWSYSRVRICPTCVYNAETGNDFGTNHDLDLRPYLREGLNSLVVYVVNGGGPGNGLFTFRVQQDCPLICNSTWDRGACAPFR